jgi:hypothetical protein
VIARLIANPGSMKSLQSDLSVKDTSWDNEQNGSHRARGQKLERSVNNLYT